MQHGRFQCFQKRVVYYEQWLQIHAEKTESTMENPKVNLFQYNIKLSLLCGCKWSIEFTIDSEMTF